MHIGIDARMYGSLHRGIGRYVQRLIEHLSRLSSGDRYTLFAQPDQAQAMRGLGGKFKVIDTAIPWYSVKEQLLMPQYVKKSGVDIMHWPHLNVPYVCPVPYVVTIHDLIVFHFPDSRASTRSSLGYFLKRKGHDAVLKNAVKKARKIITVSQFTKRDIIRTLASERNDIEVIYLGADRMVLGTAALPNTEQFTQHLAKTYGIKKHYALYVGSAYPHKNLERLVQAFEVVCKRYERDWQLVIVGRDDFFMQRLRAHSAHNAEIKDRVVFTGHVDDNALDGLYRGCRLCVIPSLYEGFGLPLLEAVTRGVPVAASKAASIPEVLADAAYYFNPYDVQSIAHALDGVGGTISIRADLIEKGLKRAKAFSWSDMAAQTSRVYHSIAA